MAKLTKKQLDEKVKVTCYRETKKMTRRAAIKLYEEGMRCCDGSERDRYTTIYFQLMDGLTEVTDEIDYY